MGSQRVGHDLVTKQEQQQTCKEQDIFHILQNQHYWKHKSGILSQSSEEPLSGAWAMELVSWFSHLISAHGRPALLYVSLSYIHYSPKKQVLILHRERWGNDTLVRWLLSLHSEIHLSLFTGWVTPAIYGLTWLSFVSCMGWWLPFIGTLQTAWS